MAVAKFIGPASRFKAHIKHILIFADSKKIQSQLR